MPEIIHCGPDVEESDRPIRWLIYGSTGTGKTYSLKTLPDKYRPCLIIDTDRGSAQLRKDSTMGTVVQFDFTDLNGRPEMFTQVKKFLQEFHAGRAKLPLPCADYKTIVLDSFTVLHSAILQDVLNYTLTQSTKGSRTSIDDPPSLPEYGMINHHGTKFLQALIQLGRNLVLICHEAAKQDNPVTGISMAGPALSKGLATNFPRYFDEILFAKAIGQGDDRRYVWNTQASGLYEARSRYLVDLGAEIEQDFGVYA
jgi:hypothetical protein